MLIYPCGRPGHVSIEYDTEMLRSFSVGKNSTVEEHLNRVPSCTKHL